MSSKLKSFFRIIFEKPKKGSELPKRIDNNFVENLSGDEIENILRTKSRDTVSLEKRHAVLRHLGRRAADHLVILAGLLVDDDQQTKQLSRTALRGVMNSVVPTVLADLRNPDPLVRFIGVSVLSELAPITDRTALNALRHAANDPDAGVRLEAILALNKSNQGVKAG